MMSADTNTEMGDAYVACDAAVAEDLSHVQWAGTSSRAERQSAVARRFEARRVTHRGMLGGVQVDDTLMRA